MVCFLVFGQEGESLMRMKNSAWPRVWGERGDHPSRSCCHRSSLSATSWPRQPPNRRARRIISA